MYRRKSREEDRQNRKPGGRGAERGAGSRFGTQNDNLDGWGPAGSGFFDGRRLSDVR